MKISENKNQMTILHEKNKKVILQNLMSKFQLVKNTKEKEKKIKLNLNSKQNE